MSRTPVSEFNARMGLDISPLEQAVPRATALLRKLSSVQAEAFAAQSGGPDMQAMTERMRSASSSPQRLGLGGGGTATFKDPASAQAFTDPIGAANEESIRRDVIRRRNAQAIVQEELSGIASLDMARKAVTVQAVDFQALQLRHIQEVKDAEQTRAAELLAAETRIAAKKQADFDLVEGGLRQLKGRDEQRAMELIAYEDSIAQRRMASAQAINEFDTQRSSLIRNSARESAAAFQAEFKAVEAIAAKKQADFDLVENGLRQLKGKDEQRAMELIAYEDSIAQRRIASAQSINEFETQRSTLIRNSAKESAAAFQADFRAAQADIDAALERQGIETEIAAIRRRQAQAQATARFDRANPFEQEILSVQELNRLLVVRRGLQRNTVEFAQAELAVTQQIARVRSIRDNLNAGGEGMRRLGNTAADSQRGISRFGLGMQQAGYQVQDFAVQIASGTNALTALSQQGSQLLGFFGGFYGAIAGAVLSVGVLAYKMYDLSRSSGTSKESLEELSSAIQRVNQAITESKYNRMTLPEKRVQIKTNISQSKTELRELRVAAAFISNEKERSAILLKQEEIRLRLVNLGDDELQNKKDIAKAEAEAYAERIAQAQEFNDRIDKAIALAKSASRARLDVTGTELDKLKADMQEATFLVNSLDQGDQAKGWSMVLAIEKEAEAIRNVIDPMRARRKEQERYNALVTEGLLDQKELDKFNEISRQKTIQSLQSSSKEALQVTGGTSALGGTVGSGSANQLIDIQKAILDGIRQLVRMESTAGAN